MHWWVRLPGGAPFPNVLFHTWKPGVLWSSGTFPGTEGCVCGTLQAQGSPDKRRMRRTNKVCKSYQSDQGRLEKLLLPDVQVFDSCTLLLICFIWLCFLWTAFSFGVVQGDWITPCLSSAEKWVVFFGTNLTLEAHLLGHLVLPLLATRLRHQSSRLQWALQFISQRSLFLYPSFYAFIYWATTGSGRSGDRNDQVLAS